MVFGMVLLVSLYSGESRTPDCKHQGRLEKNKACATIGGVSIEASANPMVWSILAGVFGEGR